MPFELQELTQATCVNANPRTEMHGKELVRAIDLTFTVTGENTLLDAIAPGLRAHHYRNAAAEAAQETLPNVPIPLPNLRFPQLPTDVKWNLTKGRGYRWIWDWGREEQHVDFTDAALASLSYSLQEGGTVEVKFTVSYNGQELEDNALYGELCGLAAMGDLHIQLFAPATIVPVKKGWRSGKDDTPPATDGGGTLLDRAEGPGDDDHDDDDTGNEHPEGSPEAALAAAEAEAAGQYPTPPATRRGRKAAAVA